MHDLWDPGAPWWIFVLRAAAVYFGVMLLIRLSGKRAVGQFTPFDLILLILIGNAVQNGMNGGDNSLTVAAILSVTLVAINYATAFVIARSKTMRHIIEGHSVVIAKDGKVMHDVLNHELISKADFREAMRADGLTHISQIRIARLETDGKITFEQVGTTSDEEDA